MESSTAVAPGASAEDQEALAKAAKDADKGADIPGENEARDEAAAEPAFPKPELPGEGQLSLSVGGETPDESLIKLQGLSIAVPNGGQFKKGQFLDVVMRVRVAGVHIDDKFDLTTGTVVGTTRRHILKPLRVERVD